jgi:hypothetical protein
MLPPSSGRSAISTLHSVTTRKASISIFAMKISNLARMPEDDFV